MTFVASSMPMFDWVCIHSRSTGLFTATSDKGKLRKNSRRSGSLLMSRPLGVKSKRTTGTCSPLKWATHHVVGDVKKDW